MIEDRDYVHATTDEASPIRKSTFASPNLDLGGSEESERSYRLITSIDRIDSLLEHVALSSKLRNSESEIELERLGICNVIEDVIADSDEP